MNARWSTNPSIDPLETRICGAPRGGGLRKESRPAVSDGPVRPLVDGLDRWSPKLCDYQPGVQLRNPNRGTSVERGDAHRDRAAASTYGEHFVTDETNPNRFRGFPVEEVCADRLLDIATQLLPGISLGDDRLRQAFGNVATVCILGHLEYDFGIHTASLASRSRPC